MIAALLVAALIQDPHAAFLDSIEEGLARARAEGRPLFVDLGHPW